MCSVLLLYVIIMFFGVVLMIVLGVVLVIVLCVVMGLVVYSLMVVLLSVVMLFGNGLNVCIWCVSMLVGLC